MTQGRKCKTVLASGLAMIVALAIACLAPAIAMGQAAGDEYDLNDLPSASGNSGGDQSDSQGGSLAPTSSGGGGQPPSAGESEKAGGTNASSDGSGRAGHGSTGTGTGTAGAAGGESEDGGGKGEDGGFSPTPVDSQQAPSVSPKGSSDDGGAPILLIVLAVVAAVCAGLAVWRMRRGDYEEEGQPTDPPGAGRKPGGATGVTESHST
jgi:cobalamin biosynthesis Mg chelatase CobN